MLKAFCGWLVDELGLELGKTLHAGMLRPEAPDLSTAVLERGGEVVHPENKALREKAIQLFTRGPSYFTARDEAFRIFEFVVNQTGVQLDGCWVHSVTGNAPQWVSQDERRRVEFSANILVRYRKED